MILFRHTDPRRPFLWESSDQPEGRWHAWGDGPTQYLADTPDGAWAEFLRNEEIVDPADLDGIERARWAVEINDQDPETPSLPAETTTGGRETYAPCQREAQRLRDVGAGVLAAPCAALKPETPSGWRTDGGPVPGPVRDKRTWAFFGRFPGFVGWAAAGTGRPRPDLLDRVNHF